MSVSSCIISGPECTLGLWHFSSTGVGMNPHVHLWAKVGRRGEWEGGGGGGERGEWEWGRSTGRRGVQSVAFPCVVRANRTVMDEFAIYWLTWWQHHHNIADTQKLMCVCVPVMWLFCSVLLVFVFPSCKSIYRVYITKQVKYNSSVHRKRGRKVGVTVEVLTASSEALLFRDSPHHQRK